MIFQTQVACDHMLQQSCVQQAESGRGSAAPVVFPVSDLSSVQHSNTKALLNAARTVLIYGGKGTLALGWLVT